MSNSIYNVKVGWAGFDPLVANNKHRTLYGLVKLIGMLALGSRLRVAGATLQAKGGLVEATGTVSPSAVQSGDTVTINGTALTATAKTARGTVTCTAANTDVDDELVIGSVTLTAKNSENTAAGQFKCNGTDAQMATSIAACIAANATLTALIDKAVASNVVHLKAKTAGTAGNSIVLTSTDADGIAVSGSGTLGSGAAVANNQFDFHAQFNVQTGQALAAAIAASSTSLVSGHVTASANGSTGVVTLTAVYGGLAGNAVTLASSDGGRLAVSGARLTGGTETSSGSYTF